MTHRHDVPHLAALALLVLAGYATSPAVHANEAPGGVASPRLHGAADSIVLQTRCSDPDAAEKFHDEYLGQSHAAEKLSDKFLGRLQKDPGGVLRARVWDLYGLTTGRGRIAVEGEVIRFVLETTAGLANGPADNRTNHLASDAPTPCTGGLREFHATLPGLPAGRNYRLQADELILRRPLAKGVEAEIGLAVDCGGPVAEAVSSARADDRPLETSWLDARTLKVVIHATHTGGRWLEPTIGLSGRRLEAGYRNLPVAGTGVVPACLFSNRITYVISGAAADTTVVLSPENERPWSMWAAWGGFAVFFGLGPVVALRRWIKRRQAHAARPRSAT